MTLEWSDTSCVHQGGDQGGDFMVSAPAPLTIRQAWNPGIKFGQIKASYFFKNSQVLPPPIDENTIVRCQLSRALALPGGRVDGTRTRLLTIWGPWNPWIKFGPIKASILFKNYQVLPPPIDANTIVRCQLSRALAWPGGDLMVPGPVHWLYGGHEIHGLNSVQLKRVIFSKIPKSWPRPQMKIR